MRLWLLTPQEIRPAAVILALAITAAVSFTLGHYARHEDGCPARHRKMRLARTITLGSLLGLCAGSLMAIAWALLLATARGAIP